MKNLITQQKIEKYLGLTEKALKIAMKNISKKRKNEAEEIIIMADNYLSDAKYFKIKGDFVNSFAAINYAHGWLDAGARLKIFKVRDRKIFTI